MKRPLHQDKDERITLEDCELAYDRGYRDGHEAGYKVAHEAITNIIKRVLEEIKP